MGDEKRKRSPNWLASEKHLLLDLVQIHFAIIENKKTDGVTMKQKIAEWKIMSDKYNSQTIYSHRTAENLKAQWESMKKSVKKEASNIRMHLFQTGGGPPKAKTEDPFYNRVISLITPSAVGLHNPFDNDASETGYESQDTQETGNVSQVHVIEVEPTMPCTSAVTIKEPDWGNYTPSLLQTPVSKCLKLDDKGKKGIDCKWSSKRRPELSMSSLELLHEKKIAVIEIQKQHASKDREEAKSLHEINMQIKREELKIRKEDLQIKKEELRQNKIKTRLLILELRAKKNVLL